MCPSSCCSQAGGLSQLAARVIASLTNVTLLDRPTSARTLVSAVQAAMRARAASVSDSRTAEGPERRPAQA